MLPALRWCLLPLLVIAGGACQSANSLGRTQAQIYLPLIPGSSQPVGSASPTLNPERVDPAASGAAQRALVDIESLVANNAGGLVSNHAAGLSGQVWVASGLVSNHSAGLAGGGTSPRRVASLAEVPLQRALIYLSDTRERPFLDPETGQVLATTTDDSGAFKFAKAPAGETVVVNAALSGNRRLVGFQIPVERQEAVLRLDLASTLVTEFLRERALERGATASLGDLDPGLRALPELTRLTREGLTLGAISIPDLRVGRIPDMNRRYLVEFATSLPLLRGQWEDLLGEKLSVVETMAGSIPGFRGDGGPAKSARFSNPSGLVRRADGSWLVADTGNNRVRRIAPDGTMSTMAGNGTPESITARILAGEIQDVYGVGGAAEGTILFDPRSVQPLPGGSWLLGAVGNSSVYHIDPAGTLRALVDPHPGGVVSEGNVRTGSPRPTLRSPIGMALSPDGKVYIADITHRVIRRLVWTDEAKPDTYVIDKVAGRYGVQGTVPIGMSALYQQSPPAETALSAPYGICFDAEGQLIFTDTFANRVLRIEKGDGRLHVLAGSGHSTVSGDGGPATQAGLPFPTAIVYDAKRNRILVGSWQSPRIRAINLSSGLITTLAGAGEDAQDGLLRKAALGDIGGLALDDEGRPVFTEVQMGRVRRLWLSE